LLRQKWKAAGGVTKEQLSGSEVEEGWLKGLTLARFGWIHITAASATWWSASGAKQTSNHKRLLPLRLSPHFHLIHFHARLFSHKASLDAKATSCFFELAPL
jgi:hypothetical protein